MTEMEQRIAKNIVEMRHRANIKQKDLAARLGLTCATLSNWENQYNTMGIEALFRICEQLGVSIYEICDVTPPPSEPALTTEETALLIAYRNQPTLHASVHRLLGIKPPQAVSKTLAARLSKSHGPIRFSRYPVQKILRKVKRKAQDEA